MRVALALLIVALTGCATTSDGPSPGAEMRAQWQACVIRSVAGMPNRFSEPDASVEAAFQACRTEEDVIRAYFLSLNGSPSEYEPVLAMIRARTKAEIVQILRRGPGPS